MKLKKLEMALQKLDGFPGPRAALEQYQTPAPLAARLLYDALMQGDIAGKAVCDLGSGTGVLAIGASLLGASRVKAVEIDSGAAAVAKKNAALAGADIDFIIADVRDPDVPVRVGQCDTVVMNPPFGAQKAHADRPFIDCALAVAPVVYGIFNAGSIPFVTAYTEGRAQIAGMTGGSFPIRRTFAFHTKDVQDTGVEILRLKRTPQNQR
ncbi:MAG TPA: METTL5 family protein [Methanoregula sp.]|nr:METTL5 family protein [Methanoregula sp.]